MLLTDQVRETCRAIAESARFVSIDLDRLETFEPPERAPNPDFVEGTPDDVADDRVLQERSAVLVEGVR